MQDNIKFSKELSGKKTSIKDLLIFDIPVHGDSRGWFKENWQKEKMTDQKIGLPDFNPIQNNISFNAQKGVTRGLHAEPWDKYISTGSGSVYGVWCDIRKNSPTYGKVFTHVIDPSVAIFVPRGVANGFQALEDNTVYTYLVNDHWSPDAVYSNVSIFDETLNINWPISLDEAIISDKDKNHPDLKNATPIEEKKILVTGANGQLGKALKSVFKDAEFATKEDLDLTSNLHNARKWNDYKIIINAAAYTQVDNAESKEGRKTAWSVNAKAVGELSKIANKYNITLVHISSDYVFDGTKQEYDEQDDLCPLGVYGQTKAAGDLLVSNTKKHYIIRTSWVIGDGNNFVKTMQNLADKNIEPDVINDQIGRLTFTDDIAKGIEHLISNEAEYGTYNLTSSGEKSSWCDIAKAVYELSGKKASMVSPVSTEEYYENMINKLKKKAKDEGSTYEKPNISPRPSQSSLNINKIEKTGFKPKDWQKALKNYIDTNK